MPDGLKNLAAPLLRFQCVWTERKRIEELRYMHRNPVKRGLVSQPEQWSWSSFRSYAFGRSVAFLPANSELNPKSRGRGARATRACIHKSGGLEPASPAAYIETSFITSLTFCSRDAAENGLGR